MDMGSTCQDPRQLYIIDLLPQSYFKTESLQNMVISHISTFLHDWVFFIFLQFLFRYILALIFSTFFFLSHHPLKQLKICKQTFNCTKIIIQRDPSFLQVNLNIFMMTENPASQIICSKGQLFLVVVNIQSFMD